MLWRSWVSFTAVSRKLRYFTTAMAIVVEVYTRPEKDSDGEPITASYNVITLRNQSGKRLHTFTISGSRKVGEQYLLCYDPAADPADTKNILGLSLFSTWLLPLLLLFLGILLISTSVLCYFFE